MSVVTTTRVYNGINVKVNTNTETGAVTVTSPNKSRSGGDLTLFSSDGKAGDWKVNSPSGLRNLYNKANRSQKTSEQLEREFLIGEYVLFDQDRAGVIMDDNNYSGVSNAVRSRQTLSEQGVPLITNPVTKKENNSQGVAIDRPTENTDTTAESVTSTAVDNYIDKQEQQWSDVPDVGYAKFSDNYRYPLGQIPALGYDFVKISAFDYCTGS